VAICGFAICGPYIFAICGFAICESIFFCKYIILLILVLEANQYGFSELKLADWDTKEIYGFAAKSLQICGFAIAE
jgi:hypothetical protein